MGKYKRNETFYNNRWQRTEDLIADAFSFAQRKPSETYEISAHLMSQAFEEQDDELMNVARDLMREAGSPCHFKAVSTSEQATDNNNRPLEPAAPQIPEGIFKKGIQQEEDWDDSLDFIFNKCVKPSEIKKTIESISSEKIKGRRFYYVAYRILKVIKWIPVTTAESEFLRWINLHFNCGWEKNTNQKKAFLFNLDGTVKMLVDLHPSEWKDDTIYSDLGKHYRLLALSFKNAFTQTIINGEPVDNSDSYEHLRDQPQFLTGAEMIFDMWHVPTEAYINNGK